MDKAKSYFKEGESHEFDHTKRVLRNALTIAETEEVDLEVVHIAALLHDIMRSHEDLGKINCHAEEGAKEAEIILREFKFPEEKISKVLDSIKTHRLSKNLKPETKEGEILQDADRLDSLGALLVARSFSSAYIYNRPFYSEEGDNVIKFIKDRSEKLKPENFNTSKGKELAKERYDYSESFIERFIKEWSGKK